MKFILISLLFWSVLFCSKDLSRNNLYVVHKIYQNNPYGMVIDRSSGRPVITYAFVVDRFIRLYALPKHF